MWLFYNPVWNLLFILLVIRAKGKICHCTLPLISRIPFCLHHVILLIFHFSVALDFDCKRWFFSINNICIKDGASTLINNFFHHKLQSTSIYLFQAFPTMRIQNGVTTWSKRIFLQALLISIETLHRSSSMLFQSSLSWDWEAREKK